MSSPVITRDQTQKLSPFTDVRITFTMCTCVLNGCLQDNEPATYAYWRRMQDILDGREDDDAVCRNCPRGCYDAGDRDELDTTKDCICGANNW